MCLSLQKKFRRVRQLDSDEEDEGGGVEGVDEEGEGGEREPAILSRRSGNVDDLTHEVFGDSDEEELPDTNVAGSHKRKKKLEQVGNQSQRNSSRSRGGGGCNYTKTWCFYMKTYKHACFYVCYYSI